MKPTPVADPGWKARNEAIFAHNDRVRAERETARLSQNPDAPAFPLIVDGAGSSWVCEGHTVPILVLEGDENAHSGIRIGVPCRLVADLDSPLTFTGMGDGWSPGDLGHDTRRAVVLYARWPSAFRESADLIFERVRLEYADGVA